MYSQPGTKTGAMSGSPLPSLRTQRGFDGTGSSTLATGHTSPLDADGARSQPVFGKAWSPPASLNGTLTGHLPRDAPAHGAAPERQFALTSSLRATPPKTARPPTQTRSISPLHAPVSARTTNDPVMDRWASTSPEERVGGPRRVLFATDGPAAAVTGASLPAAGGDAFVVGSSKATAGPAPASMRSNAAAPKSERIADIDRFVTKQAASYVPEPQRNANIRRAIEDVARVYPTLAPIMLQVNRYVKEVGTALHNAETTHAKALEEQQRHLLAKFETFFEGKITHLLKERANQERAMEQLHHENFTLRQERDGELSELKVDLMRRLNECEKREDEFRSFRQLIAAVFKTNEQLTNRVEDLELVLAQHGLEVPPANEDMFRYSHSTAADRDPKEGGGNSDDTRRRRRDEAMGKVNMLPPAFMQASKEEMNMSRLTLQQELLRCAFDDRSAYRLQISGLKQENNNLKYELSNLATTVEKLNRYIHEKRFLAPTYDEEGNVVRPMTPRPRDVPFGVETELGVDLKGSTSQIVSELSAVATNLKHQLNSALLRLRQATTVSEWMTEETLLELDAERHGDVGGVLPTFPVNAWPTIPHFLRTSITPDVDNFRWSQSDIAAVLLTFFQRYHELRAACRYVRDAKMVAPRVYQQFERREVVLTRLDATKEEVSRSEDAVPFGYVVTEFIRAMLMQLTPGTKEASLALPGTLHPRFTVRGEERVVELEFTRFAYNVWWAAQRYRSTQPLCRLFLDIVNGRLSVGVFEVTQKVLAGVLRYVREKLDRDGSHTFAYQRLVGGVARLVSDMDAHATRCGVLAVAQTFEENQVPIMGGRVRLDALVADESCCVPEAKLGTDNDAPGAGTGRQHAKPLAFQTASNLPPTITARRVPGWQLQPLGASVFVRYWRRLVLERYEKVYSFVERTLAPLVVESDVVLGLYLLPVPETLERAGCLDADLDAKAADFGAESVLFFPSDSALPLAVEGTSPSDGALATRAPSDAAKDEGAVPRGDGSDAEDAGPASEAYERAAQAVPEVTRSYMALLRHRKQVIRDRQVAERVLLATLVRDVLEDLPRLNRSVHFPFSSADPSHGGVDGMNLAGLPNALRGDGHATAKPAPGKDGSTAKKAKKGKKPMAQGKSKRKAEGGVPPTPAAEASQPTPPLSSPSAARPKSSANAKASAPNEVVPLDMVTTPDKEMTEWYGFCSALRQHALHFTEMIFSAEFLDEHHEPAARSANQQGEDSEDGGSADEEDKPFADHFDEEPAAAAEDRESAVLSLDLDTTVAINDVDTSDAAPALQEGPNAEADPQSSERHSGEER